jgi:hypothetical protein
MVGIIGPGKSNESVKLLIMVKTNRILKINLAPPIPGDHGAYVMLLVPAVLGLIVGIMRGLDPEINILSAAVLLFLAILAVFFAFEPLDVLAKPNINPVARRKARVWLGIYLGMALVSGIPLLLVWQRWSLGWLVIPALLPLVTFLIAKKWRRQRSLGVRWLGIAGLVVSGPACYYLATGKLDGMALGLWVVGLVYFGNGLFYIRIWFEAKKRSKIKPGEPPIPVWLFALTVGSMVGGLLVVAGFAALQLLPWTTLLIFAPMVAKMSMALRRPATYLPIKQVGLFELAHSFVFALLVLVAFR